jgi:methyl-accepting chemotaxis protein
MISSSFAPTVRRHRGAGSALDRIAGSTAAISALVKHRVRPALSAILAWLAMAGDRGTRTALNLTIPRKLSAAFTLLIAILLIESMIIEVNVSAFHRAEIASDDNDYASARASDMMIAVVEQQNAVRAYVFIGQPEFLAHYAESSRALVHATGAFLARSDMPVQRARARAFAADAVSWQKTSLARMIALARDPATRPAAFALAGTLQLGHMRAIMAEIRRDQSDRSVQIDIAQQASGRAVLWALMLGGALAAVCAGLLGWLLSRTIARPIVALTATMARLAAGDSAITVPETGRRDEIGTMARALLVFRETASAKASIDAAARVAAQAKERADTEQRRVIEQIGRALAGLAEADLTVRLASFPPGYAALQTDFNAAVEALGLAFGTVARSTTVIHAGAQQIKRASDDLSWRSKQQAVSIEEAAGEIDAITTTVRGSAASAVRTNALVAEARADAESSLAVVDAMVAAMQGIERSSREIAVIVALIESIASETGLLALNARIEAGRADGQNAAFAVVAHHMRELAQRAATAAKEVKAKICASTADVVAGAALVDRAGRSFDRIVARVTETSDLVAQIKDAAQHQAEALDRVNDRVAAMDNVTQHDSEMASEATAATRGLALEADILARQIGRFRFVE